MSTVRCLCLLNVVASSIFATGVATAQRFQPFGPLDFGHDVQMFAPAEISSFGGGPEPNRGYFASYDRVNWNVSRPQGRLDDGSGAFLLGTSQPDEMDWTWGHRLDLGYMTDEEHGWLLEVLNVGGPNVAGFTGLIRNEPASTTDFRIFAVENSLDYTSVELMKQWRLKQLHRGSYVDVFAGARYGRMMHERGAILSINTGTPAAPVLEPFGVDVQTIESHMWGPQAGLRWFKQKGRWTLSSEGRYFIFWAQQFIHDSGFVPTGDPAIPAVQNPLSIDRRTEANHACDVRGEVSYDISKSFAISTGIDVLYLGSGAGRGLPPRNSQHSLFVGWTIGFKINR